MRQIMCAVAAMMSFAAWTSDLVTNVTIRQVRPWQGMVEIRYELTENLSAAESPTTTVTFTDCEHDTNYEAKTFTHPFTYTKGTKRMIWNAAKDGVSFKSSNVVCTVSVTSGGTPTDEGLYCVVDLSGGTSASSYPVIYLASVPAGGWTDEYKTTKLVLRRIDSGTFTMGSPSDELGHIDNGVDGKESQHQVSLTKGFYLGVFEVTQRQWELVMGNRPSYFNNDTYYATRPVEQVSYNTIRGSSSGTNWPTNNAVNADSFLGKIRAKTGQVFDLPTEAQWEYACRAGTTTALNSGKNLTSIYKDENMAEVGRYWYNGGSNCDSNVSTEGATAKVGSYSPNVWGLYDMHGNVHEWCLDRWQGDLGTDAMTDPVGATSGDNRLLRGGCWYSDAFCCRSARRGNIGPSFELRFYGFRLSCSAGSSK